MQWIATRVAVFGLLVLPAGCEQKKPLGSNAPSTTMDDSVRESVYATDDSDTYASDGQYVASQETGIATPVSASAGGGAEPVGSRTHTVARGDTLYGMARVYYGDQRQWREIYEANRGQLADPNALRVGQQLTIP